jgi:hypothetical protein
MSTKKPRTKTLSRGEYALLCHAMIGAATTSLERAEALEAEGGVLYLGTKYWAERIHHYQQEFLTYCG